MSSSPDKPVQPFKWLNVTAALALLSGLAAGLMALFKIGNAELLLSISRWVSIACGVVAAMAYVLLRKRDRARAALLGNLALVGGLMALGAWQLLQN